MKKLTKAQRRKFYLDAAEYFLDGGVGGFCRYMMYEADLDFSQRENNFPEFYLFGYSNTGHWFSNQIDRGTALLFCYEMCK